MANIYYERGYALLKHASENISERKDTKWSTSNSANRKTRNMKPQIQKKILCCCFVFYICFLSIKCNKVAKKWHNPRCKTSLKEKPSKLGVFQNWRLWKIKMHIFSLCAFGSSFCFHPWSNLSIEERTKQVNTCHSVSASFSGDWCVESESTFVFFLFCPCFLFALAVCFCQHRYMWFCKIKINKQAKTQWKTKAKIVNIRM